MMLRNLDFLTAIENTNVELKNVHGAAIVINEGPQEFYRKGAS